MPERDSRNTNESWHLSHLCGNWTCCKRDAIIKERDDAQRAWVEMGAKYERALETILKHRDDSTKIFKDLPYLTQRKYEPAEEKIVQHNAP